VVPFDHVPSALESDAGLNDINAGVNLCDVQSPPLFSEEDLSGDNPAFHGFQVQVNGYPVAALPDRERAEAIAHHWETLFTTPEFSVNDLEPTMVNNRPAGRSGDHLLFTISPDLAEELSSNGDLLAIAWVNNLRTALGTLPLDLTDAQVQLYDLTPTQESLRGIASWYGPYFHGKQTATGEAFDQNAFTAAHPSLPFDTHLLVTNLDNGQSVVVRINDRGPYIGRRSLDLSRAAARCIGGEHDGIVPYEAIVLDVDADADSPPFPFTIPLDGEVPELTRS
jgi:rare lipoprotein A